MSGTIPCLCCLMRPPDKGLNVSYTILGKTEVYSVMLKDCFEIQVPPDIDNANIGICEVCVMRLRDACDFKQQVQQCQQDLHTRLNELTEYNVKEEPNLNVKEEADDILDDNGIYFLELKEEDSDYEDNKNLAEFLGLNDVSIKKHSDKRRKKRLLHDKKKGTKSKKLKDEFEKALRSVKNLTSMKNLLHTSTVAPSIKLVNDNMKHKLNIQNLLRHSNCTPFLNKTIAGIICCFCKDTYPDLDCLRTHIRDSHENDCLIERKKNDKNNLSIKMDITNLHCNLCLNPFDRISNLKTHLTKNHDIKFYPDTYDYILEFKLNDSKINNCALCHSTFETFKMLLQHMNGHYRNFICNICDQGFLNKHKLNNHQRTHELGTFNCSFCDKIFSTKVRQLCHEKYTHNTSARYTTNCPHCDESFTSYYRRNRHMATEHNNAAAIYKCNICDKSFILKSKLTSHIKKVHLMERNHICPECGHGFFIKQSLDEHMIKHKGERVFQCTFCPKAFARKKTLREHLRIHNNDRRFKCGICLVAFVQKCSLKSHMLSNHGITLAEYEAKVEGDSRSSPVD